MSRVFVDGFDFSELPNGWVSNNKQKLSEAWYKMPRATLGDIIKANTTVALMSGNDIRAAFNFISPEGAFSVTPVRGNPVAWTIEIIMEAPNAKRPQE